MTLSVASLMLTPCGFFWRAEFVDETGAVVGATLVSGRTRAKALASARAIAARVSSSSSFGRGPGSFAARSIACVRAVASADNALWALSIGTVSGLTPAGVVAIGMLFRLRVGHLGFARLRARIGRE